MLQLLYEAHLRYEMDLDREIHNSLSMLAPKLIKLLAQQKSHSVHYAHYVTLDENSKQVKTIHLSDCCF